jgi:flagellar biosynthesis/type III secretory pathway M-ring protein FliF/YscJ
VGAVVLGLALTAFLFFKFKKGKKQTLPIAEPVPTIDSQTTPEIAPPAEATHRTVDDQIAENAAEHERQLAEAMAQLAPVSMKTKKHEALTNHLTAQAKKEPEVIAQLIRTWLNEGDS